MKRPAATILHVDMDAFYAAVEVRDDPSLAGRPLIVGGTGRRGVVASCSYEARAFGIHSAMPSLQARQLCPTATFVAGHYDRYAQVSQDLHRIFSDFTPLVEGIALDEAFLDVTGSERLFGPATAIADRIRARVAGVLGLSCSVGVAASKFLAKLASEAAKPSASRQGVTPGRGVVLVAAGDELTFLHPLPIEALWGVGPATATRLRRLGVTTVGQLAAVPQVALESALGKANGRHLHALSLAIDDRAVEPDRAVKSIGHEETYPVDRYDRDTLHREVVRMADAVAGRLRQAGMAGRTVTLKVRYGDFATISRSRTARSVADSGPVVARAATELLDQVDLTPGVRLLGISVSNLVPRGDPGAPAPKQLALDLSSEPPSTDEEESSDLARWAAASVAVDDVRRRFGERAVGPAALLDADGLALKRRGDTQWGPPAEHGSGR